MVEFTVDLGELSVPVLRFGPFCWTFLHRAGGATPDNCKQKVKAIVIHNWKDLADLCVEKKERDTATHA